MNANVEACPKASVYADPVPDYGDVMTVADFKNAVKTGFFIDYDGFGYPIKDDRCSDTRIFTSKIETLPKDATHVVWFNR